MITELRESMRRQAERVVPRPEPFARLIIRRRRRKARITALVMAPLLALLAGVSVSVSTGQPAPAGPPPANLRPLLDSPTRGSLAGETDFLGRLRWRASREVDQVLTGDRNLIKVLYAGDVPGERRLVVLASVTEAPMYVAYLGDAGAGWWSLHPEDMGELTEMVATAFLGRDGGSLHELFFGAQDSRLETAGVARYLPAGPQWNWSAGQQEFFADQATTVPGTRVRLVNGAGEVVGDRRVRAYRPVAAEAVLVSPLSLAGKDDDFRGGVGLAAHDLARLSGLDSATATFILRWHGQLPVEGAFDKGVVTVVALTPDGGGHYLTQQFRGRTLADGPLLPLTVARFPDWPGVVQFIAAPGAVRVEVVAAGEVLAKVDLTDGVALTKLPPGVTVTARAYDADANLTAEVEIVTG